MSLPCSVRFIYMQQLIIVFLIKDIWMCIMDSFFHVSHPNRFVIPVSLLFPLVFTE